MNASATDEQLKTPERSPPLHGAGDVDCDGKGQQKARHDGPGDRPDPDPPRHQKDDKEHAREGGADEEVEEEEEEKIGHGDVLAGEKAGGFDLGQGVALAEKFPGSPEIEVQQREPVTHGVPTLEMVKVLRKCLLFGLNSQMIGG